MKTINLGRRVLFRLVEIDKDQAWLSRESGVDKGVISATIKRNSRTSIHTPALAKALGVCELWLIDGTGQKERQGTGETDAAVGGTIIDRIASVQREYENLPKNQKELVDSVMKRDAELGKFTPINKR